MHHSRWPGAGAASRVLNGALKMRQQRCAPCLWLWGTAIVWCCRQHAANAPLLVSWQKRGQLAPSIADRMLDCLQPGSGTEEPSGAARGNEVLHVLGSYQGAREGTANGELILAVYTYSGMEHAPSRHRPAAPASAVPSAVQ